MHCLMKLLMTFNDCCVVFVLLKDFFLFTFVLIKEPIMMELNHDSTSKNNENDIIFYVNCCFVESLGSQSNPLIDCFNFIQ